MCSVQGIIPRCTVHCWQWFVGVHIVGELQMPANLSCYNTQCVYEAVLEAQLYKVHILFESWCTKASAALLLLLCMV